MSLAAGLAAAGAAMLSIDETIFASAHTSLDTSYKDFDFSAGTPYEISSQAMTLQLFREQFIELAAIMELYHSLVAKDIGVIEKAHDNITETDAAPGGAH